MKRNRKRITAAITALILIGSFAPVQNVSDILSKNVITANAETGDVTWNTEQLWYMIRGQVAAESVGLSVAFLDEIPTGSNTPVDISSDGNIKAAIVSLSATTRQLQIWSANGGKVKAPKNCDNLFNADKIAGTLSENDRSKCLKKIKSIDCSNLDTSEVTSMNSMFSNNQGLTSLNVSTLDTHNVTDMGSMFFNCSSLTSLDLSSFETSNVNNMCLMFAYCSKLASLNVSSFDTSAVNSMNTMFGYDNSLSSLDISNFNTKNVTNMSSMFVDCSNLSELKLGDNFVTDNVTDMSFMFCKMKQIKTLDLSGFNTENVTDMHTMFGGCNSLTSVKFGESFKTDNVTNFSYMFTGCTNISSLDLSGFEINAEAKTDNLLNECSGLGSVKCTPDIFEMLELDENNVKRESFGIEKDVIKGCSLDITNGGFVLNVYMKIPSDLQPQKAFVRFSLPDGSEKDVSLNDGISTIAGGVAYLVFPVEVAAKDMYNATRISIYKDESSIMQGQGEVKISEYAETLKTQQAKYSEFVDALLNYGKYAETYFSSKEYDASTDNPKDYDWVYYKAKAGEITASAGISDENYVGSTLLLKQKVILRHYFSSKVDGAAKKDDYWYIEETFNPTRYGDQIEGYSFTVNDYIKKALTNSDDVKLKNLCCALNAYSIAADKLVNGQY